MVELDRCYHVALLPTDAVNTRIGEGRSLLLYVRATGQVLKALKRSQKNGEGLLSPNDGYVAWGRNGSAFGNWHGADVAITLYV